MVLRLNQHATHNMFKDGTKDFACTYSQLSQPSWIHFFYFALHQQKSCIDSFMVPFLPAVKVAVLYATGWILQTISGRRWQSWIFPVSPSPQSLLTLGKFIPGAAGPMRDRERSAIALVFLFHQWGSTDRRGKKGWLCSLSVPTTAFSHKRLAVHTDPLIRGTRFPGAGKDC